MYIYDMEKHDTKRTQNKTIGSIPFSETPQRGGLN